MKSTCIFLTAASLLTLGLGDPTAVHAQDSNGAPPPRGSPGGPGGGPLNPLHDLVRSVQHTEAEKTAFQGTLANSNAQIKAIQLDAMTKTVSVVTTTAEALRPAWRPVNRRP